MGRAAVRLNTESHLVQVPAHRPRRNSCILRRRAHRNRRRQGERVVQQVVPDRHINVAASRGSSTGTRRWAAEKGSAPAPGTLPPSTGRGRYRQTDRSANNRTDEQTAAGTVEASEHRAVMKPMTGIGDRLKDDRQGAYTAWRHPCLRKRRWRGRKEHATPSRARIQTARAGAGSDPSASRIERSGFVLSLSTYPRRHRPTRGIVDS